MNYDFVLKVLSELKLYALLSVMVYIFKILYLHYVCVK